IPIGARTSQRVVSPRAPILATRLVIAFAPSRPAAVPHVGGATSTASTVPPSSYAGPASTDRVRTTVPVRPTFLAVVRSSRAPPCVAPLLRTTARNVGLTGTVVLTLSVEAGPAYEDGGPVDAVDVAPPTWGTAAGRDGAKAMTNLVARTGARGLTTRWLVRAPIGIYRAGLGFVFGSRLPAPGSRLPAPGSRLPAPGSSCSSTGDEAPAGGGSWSSRSSTARLATST